MHVDVNGTRLWFDVEGAALVLDGPGMRHRPTILLVHGGPGTWDHSYLKPYFGRLSEFAQVVYVDLRGHGRSAWGDAAEWSFEACADDLAAFCETVGIDRPCVVGHSMGGFVALLHAMRHPAQPAALILLSTFARFDLDDLVDGFHRVGGAEVARIARRDYRGDVTVTDEEWARAAAVFGPSVPNAEVKARRIQNLEVAARGVELMRSYDVTAHLARIECPTLVCVGDLDPITSIDTSKAIVAALPPGIGRLEVIAGAGHFPWLDQPDTLADLLRDFVKAHPD